MQIDLLKKDLLNILDLEPAWISNINNPIYQIIKDSKTHELLLVLRSLYGIIDGNPIIKRINKEHYRQDKIQIIFRKIVDKEKDLRIVKDIDEQFVLGLISALSEIEYFKIYPNRYSDTFIKTLIKSNLIDKIDNIEWKSKLLFLLTKMGYSNIYIDRELKKIETKQNRDGGWGNLLEGESDVFSSLLTYQCYKENRLWRNRKVVLKAEKYLIKNHLSSNQTKNEQDKWNRIHSGYRDKNMFEGGSLVFLESLLLEPNDSSKSKVKALIKWFKELQLDSGYFPYHAGLRKQGNIISTIRVLCCMKKYYLQNNE